VAPIWVVLGLRKFAKENSQDRPDTKTLELLTPHRFENLDACFAKQKFIASLGNWPNTRRERGECRSVSGVQRPANLFEFVTREGRPTIDQVLFPSCGMTIDGSLNRFSKLLLSLGTILRRCHGGSSGPLRHGGEDRLELLSGLQGAYYPLRIRTVASGRSSAATCDHHRRR
jgi:hypothetical protein